VGMPLINLLMGAYVW